MGELSLGQKASISKTISEQDYNKFHALLWDLFF